MKLTSGEKYTAYFLNSLSVITILTLLVAVFSVLLDGTDKIDIFFSSDTLYLPSVYKDIFTDHNKLKGWHFNPAPNYFPDMLFYFLIMFVTNNFIVASFVFAIVQYMLIAFLFVKLFKLIFPASSDYSKLLIYSLLSFFLLETFFFTRDFLYNFYLLVNSYHAGAFVMTLVCTYQSFKYILDKKMIRLAAVFVIGILMILSDQLFVVLFSVPLCFTSLCMIRKIGIKVSSLLILSCVLYIVIGFPLAKIMDTDTYGILTPNSKIAPSEVILKQFDTFYIQVCHMLKMHGFRAVTVYMFIVSLLMMVYTFFSSLRRYSTILLPFYALFSLGFSVCVICAPMLTGKYLGNDCLRYNIYPFYLSVLNIAVFIFHVAPSLLEKGRFIVIGLNVLLLAVGFCQLDVKGLKEYFNYYPENARLLDEVAEANGLKCGVANYWEAKKITMFSKKGIKVYAVFDDIAFHQHVNNDDWFFKNKFNFVLFTRFTDTTLFKTKAKDIQIISNAAKFKLVKTRPFYYDPPVGSTMINTEINEN